MLILNNLSKNFQGRFVLQDITYNFPSNGIIALVGVNGAGKSTLLNILCNLTEADSGSVIKPKNKLLGYLPQEPNPNPLPNLLLECMAGAEELFKIKEELERATKEMESNFSDSTYERFEYLEKQFRDKDGYSFEYNATKILLGLGFTEEQLILPPTSLSGGWRMRLELAKILIKDPDFLILDEPTNHLDLPTILWLENYLKKFKGTVLFVSHDEELLNSLPNIILHLKDGALTEYQGNFEKFNLEFQEQELNKLAQVKNIENKVEALSQFVERFRYKASKATQAQSKLKMMDRLQKEAGSINISKLDAEINIKIPLKQKSGKEVLQLEECAIGYDKPLVKNISFTIKRGQKVAIVGANGLGKSTLLKSILRQIPFIKGTAKLGHNVSAAYYAQDQAEHLNLKENVLENLKTAGPAITELYARSLLGAFLFKGNDVYKEVSVLSGGEKSRLSLACLLVKDANFLLLDEPTNHLDILSTQILSQALSQYEGTVIFVSHNRSFIKSLATHTLNFKNNREVFLLEQDFEHEEILGL